MVDALVPILRPTNGVVYVSAPSTRSGALVK